MLTLLEAIADFLYAWVCVCLPDRGHFPCFYHFQTVSPPPSCCCLILQLLIRSAASTHFSSGGCKSNCFWPLFISTCQFHFLQLQGHNTKNPHQNTVYSVHVCLSQSMIFFTSAVGLLETVAQCIEDLDHFHFSVFDAKCWVSWQEQRGTKEAEYQREEDVCMCQLFAFMIYP